MRDTAEFDVVIVGAGPAGLATAIRLLQLNSNLKVCVLEKGAEVGSHILSGAVFDPKALNELLPDWPSDAPIKTKVSDDRFYYLTKKRSVSLPLPRVMQNHGSFVISLSNLCKWLSTKAEALGAEIYPSFAASELLYDNDRVVGVATNDFGVAKDGSRKSTYQPGMELYAKHVVLSEGCRGSLTKQVIAKYALQAQSPQTYALGVKELWKLPNNTGKAGQVIHTVGWPLDAKTYGGSFIYYLEDDLIALGFVVGLDYANPNCDPFAYLQKFKLHPKITHLFVGAKRIGYGARALNEGGWQSIPKLVFPGGMLVGCSAGFLNVPRIKGSHTAMKSGMLAAEAINDNLNDNVDTSSYIDRVHASWIKAELYKARNIRPSFNYGIYAGLGYSALDTFVFRGMAPWTFKHRVDHESLNINLKNTKIEYPKPDNKLTFDKLSSVQLTNTSHEENQPIHLCLTNQQTAIDINFKQFGSPEQAYCPANVYEIIELPDKDPYLQINSGNCIHCKACDIKDPTQNITWQPPEGGSGPNYSDM